MTEIETKVFDAVSKGCCLPFMVALKLDLQPYQASAVMNRIVSQGRIVKVECADFLGSWYEFKVCGNEA